MRRAWRRPGTSEGGRRRRGERAWSLRNTQTVSCSALTVSCRALSWAQPRSLLRLGKAMLALATSSVAAVDTTAEKLALVALYEATGGENWANKAGWLNGEPCNGATANWAGLDICDDDGVCSQACHSDGSVAGLKMAENSLVGTLPTQIGRLSKLMQCYCKNALEV